MGVNGVCTPQQCAAAQAKMPVVRPQVIVKPQEAQSIPTPASVKPNGGIDIRV